MNMQGAVAAMRSLFKTAWGNTTAIAWPDVSFTPPDGAAWVRFTERHDDGYQASIGAPGNNRQRRTGFVIIQVFVPQGKGGTSCRPLADQAVLAFVNQTVQGIHFNDVHAREVGNDGHGWYQINVYARFYYDQIA